MTHYLKRTVKLTDSLDVTPKGLGYNYWLAAGRTSTGWISANWLNTAVYTDGTVDRPGGIDYHFHVHPFIKATAAHAEALGVEVGQAIAGIRWVDHKDAESPDPQLRQAAVSFDKHLARLESESISTEDMDKAKNDPGRLDDDTAEPWVLEQLDEQQAENLASDDWAIPTGLSAGARKVAFIVKRFADANGLTYTGGCRVFYSPSEWAARGETLGANSELVVCFDGAEIGSALSYESRHHELQESLENQVHESGAGLYFEQLNGWASALYVG